MKVDVVEKGQKASNAQEKPRKARERQADNGNRVQKKPKPDCKSVEAKHKATQTVS
jgi:hypothetical protein